MANGVFYPVYFILSAMITGCYLLFLMYGYKYKMVFNDEMQKFLMHLGRLLGLLIAILVFFEFWRFLTAIYGNFPERAETALHILGSFNFWVGEVLLGMAIPFVIILYSKAKALKAMIYASVSGMIGIFFMRYGLVS